MRRTIYEIIQPGESPSIAGRIFEAVITTLIMMSVVVVFAGTFDLPAGVHQVLETLECVASIAFTIEYALRIFTADYMYPKSGALLSRIKFAASPMAIVDLVAILPFWLPMFLTGSLLGLRALRLVRLLRVFKLNRYFDAMKNLWVVIASRKRELLGSLFILGLLMVLSSLMMYEAEHDAQPEVFKNAFSGLWWAVTTLTTVGYGDVYPVTAIGRFLGAFISFSGIAALAVPTGIISAGLSASVSGEKSDVDERDRMLRDQVELLKSISDKLSRIEQKENR